MKKIVGALIVLVIVFLAVGITVRILGTDRTAAPSAGNGFVPVKVRIVTNEDIQQTLDYIGNVKAQEQVLVYPKVSGKIIEKINDEGSAVLKGQAIARIDRDEVGLKFEHAPVESPFDGVVGRVYVDVGTQVTPQAAVALVLNMEKMKINLDVPERYLAKIHLDQNARIVFDAYPADVFIGQVKKISPVVNTVNRAFPIEIHVDNLDHRLKAGMFAHVTLVVDEHLQVPVVPKEALIGRGEDLYVYVVVDGKAQLRAVQIGITQASRVEILTGVEAQDKVVILGQQKLYDNAPVKVENGSGDQETP